MIADLFRRPKPTPDEQRWQRLADYNRRVGLGIVHERWYVLDMEREQRAFDEEAMKRRGLR